MKYYQKYKDLIIAILLIIILFLSIILLIKVYNKEPPINNIEELTITTTNEIASLTKEDKYFVDIKGAVKKPGVYEVTKGSIVNDQTTTNMIQRISRLFTINPLISKEI